MAYVTKAKTEFPIKPSPVIASFSSRRHSTILPSVLKVYLLLQHQLCYALLALVPPSFVPYISCVDDFTTTINVCFLFQPDITAPGVNIIAAYSEAVSACGLEPDHRIIPFNIMSGTSMSCPHLIMGLVTFNLILQWTPDLLMTSAFFIT